MENRLKLLFDYQKFENNKELNEIIEETQRRLDNELSDDELTLVSAAGVPFSPNKLHDKADK